MLHGTSRHGMGIQEKREGLGTTHADRGQGTERCAGILRILLLAKRSNPYAEQQDIRGILLDSYC